MVFSFGPSRVLRGTAYIPLTPALFCLRKRIIFMRQLDKLLKIAANENVLTKHEIELGGEDLTFWSTPLTIAEFQVAKKASKDPADLLETTARLFVKKALDEGGQPQYQADALPVLLRVLSLKTASKLLGAMQNDDDEEGTELDLKSPEAAA